MLNPLLRFLLVKIVVKMCSVFGNDRFLLVGCSRMMFFVRLWREFVRMKDVFCSV